MNSVCDDDGGSGIDDGDGDGNKHTCLQIEISGSVCFCVHSEVATGVNWISDKVREKPSSKRSKWHVYV